MKKYKVKKIKGIKVVEKIKKDHERPLIPPCIIYNMKTKYNRKREKETLRKETEDV